MPRHTVFLTTPLFLALILLLGMSSILCAEFVQPQEAQRISHNWLTHFNRNANQQVQIRDCFAYVNKSLRPSLNLYNAAGTELPELYLIHTDSNAYAIVSADDNTIPVLAYGYEIGSGIASIPPALLMWMELLAQDIRDLRTAQHPLNTWQQDWQDILANNLARFRTERDVSPMIAAKWNQDWPYNELCPADAEGPGGRVYAGCVATAMGMVMKYWNAPVTGQGSNTYYAYGYGNQSANFGNTTYLWDQMPNSISASNIPIATLLYHAAVAVDMDFSPEGSGSNGTYASAALRNHFRYPNATLAQKSNYSASGWETLLRSHMDNGTPMYYSGSNGSVGHAWALDGYQGTNYFHFNFGWSGSYDGYYYLNALNPGSNNFNVGQAAITNIIPANYTIASPRIRLQNSAALVGDPFQLSMSTYPVLSSWNVSSYDFQLFYDHTNITFNGYSIESTISAGGNVVVSQVEPGLLSVSWNRSTPLFGGGTLISFSFAAIEPGEYYFDAIGMRYNNTTLSNVDHLIANINAPVATLAESAISLGNAMQVGYQQIASMDLRTSHLLPSWNVNSYQFNIGYNPEKVTLHGLQTDQTLSAGAEPLFTILSPGLATVSCSFDAPISGSGDLVKLLFLAIGNGATSSATHITPSAFTYNDTAINSISNGYIVLAPYTANEDEIGHPISSLRAFPNPFNPHTNIEIKLDKAAPLSLRIFNHKGQLVSILHEGILLGGTHRIKWDGKDIAGKTCSSGIYFVRMQSSDFATQNHKVILIK